MGLVYKIHFNEKIPSGNLYIKLEVDLTKNSPDALVFNKTNIEWGLGLTKDVVLKYNWDEDEFLIMVGELEIALYDRFDNLRTSLKNESFKELRIELRINNELKYSGYNSGEYSKDVYNVFKLTFKHYLNKLNETPVTINGQFNYQFPVGKYNINSNTGYNFVELVQDFFRIAIPDSIVQAINNWIFWSAYFGNPLQRVSCNINQLLVQFRYVFITETGSGPQFAFQSYMEAFKSLLLSLGLWGGLVNSSTAFISSLLMPQENNNFNEMLDYKEEIVRSNYDYIEITRGLGMTWASRGNLSSIQEKSKQIIIRGDIFRVPYQTQQINMAYIERPGGSIVDYSNFLADLYANYYLQFYQYNVKISLNGINYLPYRSFLISQNHYIARELIINYTQNRTEVEAIRITPY